MKHIPPIFIHLIQLVVRKPSGSLPFEIKKSLSNEIILPSPQSVDWWSAGSKGMDDAGCIKLSRAKHEKQKAHQWRAACAAHGEDFRAVDFF